MKFVRIVAVRRAVVQPSRQRTAVDESSYHRSEREGSSG